MLLHALKKVLKGCERLCMAYLLTARLFILVVLAINAQLPVATVTTALSVKEGSLFEAITNETVTEILVTMDNYKLSRDAWSVYNEENPYHLKRDLKLWSTIDPVGQLDFMFLANKVLVGSGVTVTLQQLALRNIRKLSGFSLDFFMGEENSTIILRNVIHVKMACNPIEDAYRSALTFKSMPPWPPNNVSIIDGVCVNNPKSEKVCYSSSLYFANFTFLVRNSDPEAGLAHAGYTLHMTNTVRVCDNYITNDCIAAVGQDTCLADLLNRIINATQDYVWSPGAIAGIAVTGTAVLVVVVLCCWFRHKILHCLVKLGGKSLQELESSSSPSGGADGTPTALLLPSSTVTQGKQSATQTVRLGVLLGSGSFGRVYRGRWHGTEVAVKIISCTADELPKVLKEAEVMMQLNHPNIVRAFQCSVWNPAEQQRVLQAAKGGRASSSAAQPQSHPARGSTSSTSHPSSSVNQQTSSSQSTSRPAPRDGIVINIMPEIVQHQRPAAAAAGQPAPDTRAAGTAGSTGAGSSQGALSSGSVRLSGAGAAAASGSAAGSGSTSSSEAARRLFSKVLDPVQQHQQQQQQQEQRLMGPSTRSWSHEHPPRLVTTPLSSAAGSGGLPSSSMLQSSLQSSVQDALSPGSRLMPVTVSHTSHSAPLEGVSASYSSAVAAAAAAAVSTTAVPVRQSAPGDVAAYYAGAEAGTVPEAGTPAAAAAAAYVGSTPGSRSSTAASSSQLTRYSSGPGAIAEGKDGGVWSGIGPWQRSSSSKGATTSSSSTAAAQQATAASASEPRATAGTDVGEIQPASGGWWRRRSMTASAGSHGSKDQDPEAGSGGKAAEAVLQEQGADDSSTDEGRKEVQVWLVLELCTGGTLKDAVSLGRLRTDSRLEMAKLLSRLLDAANGMTYLHSKGVLHGDLKAGNVLLQSSMHGSYGYISKISDFGLAATLMDGATHRSTASMGTITHMAPEVLKNGHMSAAADVYSFGIMMWEVFTNRQAHSGLHYGAVVERVVLQGERPPVPDNMPNEYALLMRNCWHAEASKRPTFAQVMQCLELLLDNLTSDSEGRISEGVEERTSSSSGSEAGAAEKKEDEGAAGARRDAGQLQAKQGQLPDSSVAGASSSAIGASSRAAGPSSGASMSHAVPGPHSGTLLVGTTASGSLSGAGTSSGFQELEQQRGLVDKDGVLGRMPSGQSSSGGGMAGSGRVFWSTSLGSGSLGSGQPTTPKAQGAFQRAVRSQLRDGTGSGTGGDVEGSQFVQDL